MAMARMQERVKELEGCLTDRDATMTLSTMRIAELEVALANKTPQLADGRSSESAADDGHAGSGRLALRVKGLQGLLAQEQRAHDATRAERNALSDALKLEQAKYNIAADKGAQRELLLEKQLADARSGKSAAAVVDAGILSRQTQRVKELQGLLAQAHADRDALTLALELEQAAHNDARVNCDVLVQELSKSKETASKHETTINALSRMSASNDAASTRWKRLAYALQRYTRSFDRRHLELKPHMAPAGLERFGLTCYINVVLHCLAHTLFLTHISAARDDAFAMALAELLVAIRNGDTSRFDHDHPVLAYYRDEQDDALEYLTWLNGILEPTRVPMAVFGMNEIATRTCSDCRQSSTGRTPIHYITVKPCNSVVKALNIARPALGQEETVQRNCDECGPLHNHESHTRLDRAPPVVVVNMPCYDPSGLVEAKIVIENPAIELSIKLQAATYELVAVVVHEGISKECGHYVAYVRSRHNAPGSKDHTWYKMDDDHPVQSVTTATVKTLQGTLFFYERTDATATETNLESASTVQHGRDKRPKSPAIDDPAPKKPRHTSSEALQGGFEFSGDQPSGFEFGDGQHDDFELGGWSPTEETKEPESQALRRPDGAASPEISRRDFGSTRRDAMVHPDANYSEVQPFVATPDCIEISDDSDDEQAVAEQQRPGASEHQGRSAPGEPQSLRGPAPSTRKKRQFRCIPPAPTDRILRSNGPAPVPGPLRPQRQEKEHTEEHKIAHVAAIKASIANKERLKEILKRQARSIRAATPEARCLTIPSHALCKPLVPFASRSTAKGLTLDDKRNILRWLRGAFGSKIAASRKMRDIKTVIQMMHIDADNLWTFTPLGAMTPAQDTSATKLTTYLNGLRLDERLEAFPYLQAFANLSNNAAALVFSNTKRKKNPWSCLAALLGPCDAQHTAASSTASLIEPSSPPALARVDTLVESAMAVEASPSNRHGRSASAPRQSLSNDQDIVPPPAQDALLD
ncbi:hypothetical protein SDRG_01741 [Saprolegnia diclina VS20]|uniref:USP domain-containing protein n=1 Tax=Saprolegnia diclina (strain VS20) TaxID=1156394 RepID=T0S6A7_SAPDV|nr:hypothetical protein SDRG_01741 [Saprolegnia diclina VS20]EQC40663.1 hypothetical protein SDRG_01741 [Saprolegnia diclina VS20]|eukprot:XP_008605507.1 hypothetical protein SDRG_01741 [Saprolegnia diclina VS20]